jgi:hypothetical protein
MLEPIYQNQSLNLITGMLWTLHCYLSLWFHHQEVIQPSGREYKSRYILKQYLLAEEEEDLLNVQILLNDLPDHLPLKVWNENQCYTFSYNKIAIKQNRNFNYGNLTANKMRTINCCGFW